jgi:hypothetical protein
MTERESSQEIRRLELLEPAAEIGTGLTGKDMDGTPSLVSEPSGQREQELLHGAVRVGDEFQQVDDGALVRVIHRSRHPAR